MLWARTSFPFEVAQDDVLNEKLQKSIKVEVILQIQTTGLMHETNLSSIFYPDRAYKASHKVTIEEHVIICFVSYEDFLVFQCANRPKVYCLYG